MPDSVYGVVAHSRRVIVTHPNLIILLANVFCCDFYLVYMFMYTESRQRKGT